MKKRPRSHSIKDEQNQKRRNYNSQPQAEAPEDIAAYPTSSVPTGPPEESCQQIRTPAKAPEDSDFTNCLFPQVVEQLHQANELFPAWFLQFQESLEMLQERAFGDMHLGWRKQQQDAKPQAAVAEIKDGSDDDGDGDGGGDGEGDVDNDDDCDYDERECCIACREPFSNVRVFVTLDCCRHLMCDPCARNWSQHHNTCPQCRETFTSMSSFEPGASEACETWTIDHRRQRRPEHSVIDDTSDDPVMAAVLCGA